MGSAVNRDKIAELLDLGTDSNDDSLLRDLIDLFQVTAPKRIQSMKDALKQNDLRTVEREAHTLKTSGANLGAHKVRTVSQEIEEMIGVGQSANASAMIDILDANVNEAIAELKLIVTSPRV